MNKLIKKFLNCNIEEKYLIHNASMCDGIPNLRTFCTLLDNENWLNPINSENFSFKQNIRTFINENKENIWLKDEKPFEDIRGFWLHPQRKFGFSFRYNYMREEIYFNFTSTLDEVDSLKEYVRDNFSIRKPKKELMINLLHQNMNDFYLEEHEVSSIKKLSIEDNYNDDFAEVDKKLNDILLNKKKSLNILHGAPGTGKTTYIKHLCHKLASKGKKVVYLPPSITHVLSSPGFINNLDLFKNKIVIIEDAESILTQSPVRSEAIANILNMTDGILGDIYNIHFIFTFNMDVRKIDDALIRKGRLTLKYEFKELSPDKMNKLAKKLNITTPNKGTLSEIYNTESNGTEEIFVGKLGF